ncbi:carboxypeptidase regulatory-like domain-containing protein [Arcicella rigui]|uniref:OmpA family protein n=1 Tax=Arcicella rigui TaxID=797020 RepID=A0ABU5QAE6_9BACT|nr:carboxypeptidase regulatory-like domain-containing protein [Arcicella rigui]MEA5139703.1 OmpA family protein [Arcicella rigui]
MIILKKTVLLIWLVLLASLSSFAQTLKDAEYQFDQMSYLNASQLFEQALKGKITDAQRQSILLKLAYSYRQMHDTQNAERVYAELLSKNPVLSGNDTKAYLYYAQALASNGKYPESQAIYEKYSKLEIADNRSGGFQKLYKNIAVLNKNAACYKVDYLSINTDKADFSPMYYKNGLVFNSARTEGFGMKRVFTWDNSQFLDMYYLSDLSQLTTDPSAGLGGKKDSKTKTTKATQAIGLDEYTAPTANDTKTIGSYSGSSLYLYNETPSIKTESFSRTLNTKYHEGPMTFTSDAKKVVFTRNNYNNGHYNTSKDKVNKLKLYLAEDKGEGQWSNIQELPFNSNEYSTGHPSLTKDNKLLYFVSDMPGGIGGTDIYVAEFNDGKVGTPVNLGPEINTPGNEMFPFVDERGNLYFSSDGHPGLGDLDVFYTKLINGTKALGKVTNMGTPINSNKDDFGLITDGERKAGFFSSNRKRGSTDDDIYRFTRECDEKPECEEHQVIVYDADSKMPLDNTDVQIVSVEKSVLKKTDSNGSFKICLEPNQNYAINASRDGYLPNSLSYSVKSDSSQKVIEIPLTRVKLIDSTGIRIKTLSPCEAIKIIKGRVIANKDKRPLSGVKVVFTNQCDASEQSTVTGEDGAYEFEVCVGCEYKIEAFKEGFGSQGVSLKKITPSDPEVTIVNLIMFEEGDIIAIENIYYDYGKYNIRRDADLELNKLYQLMKKYPSMRIEIRSHTDSRATTQFNQTLSKNRSAAVVQYLVKRGIAANRMEASGYGESQLLNECADGVECTEEQHQLNRRSEFKILKLK